MKKITRYLWVILVLASCDGYLDIEPVGLVIPKSVEEYRSFLTTAYAIKSSNKILTTYRGDELTLANDFRGVDQYKDIYLWNDQNPDPFSLQFPYATFYNTIFYANHVIKNAQNMKGGQEDIDQLVGEAYALRALQYFELINLYAKPYNEATASGDAGVPIVTTYDPDADYPKKSVQKVYDLILSDLTKGESLTNIERYETGYNYRFSRLAIQAFQARVHLYMGHWQEAVDASEQVLNTLPDLQDLNIQKELMPSEYNAVESILALQEVSSFDIATHSPISDVLINKYNQTTDLRFSIYFDKNSNGKFYSKKTAQNNFKCTFRTADLYLMIAESYARLGDASLSQSRKSLLALARHRYTPAGFALYESEINAMSQEDLVQEILKERARELAIEGHRWNDLRRTSRENITKVFEGKTYELIQDDPRYVIPIPQNAKINNPNLSD